MTNCVCPVLLVEDNNDSVDLIQHFLSLDSESGLNNLTQDFCFTLSVVDSLSKALSIVEENVFAAIILDLTLPDVQNLEGLLKIRQKIPHIPIIIKIEEQDESIVVRAFQLGANGYIRINNLDRNLLVYALRIAIERQEYMQTFFPQQELTNLGIVANNIQPSITARMFGSSALKESIPEIFTELMSKYAQLLELSLEEKIFKVEHHISDDLRTLASKLGFLKASPRDIVEIHTQALKKKCANVSVAKSQAYVQEGRLRLLELMGYLTSYYRKYYIGLSNLNILSSPDSEIN